MTGVARVAAILLLGLLAAQNACASPVLGTAAEFVLGRMGDCLEFARGEMTAVSMSLLPQDASRVFSLQQVAATLGIGMLSVLFFVPAALVSEWLMRRGRDDGESGRDA